MSKNKKRRQLAEAAQTGKGQQPNRRDFLKIGLYTAGTITAAGLASVGIYEYFSDKEERLPVPNGPVSIGAKEEIIPKKYQERQISDIGIDDKEKRQIMPFLIAVLNGKDDLAENFFMESSKEAFDAAVQFDPSLEAFKEGFFKAFPEKFAMSDGVKRFILKAVIDTGRKRGMDNDTMLNMADVLIRHGADPLAILRDDKLPLQAVKAVIDIMPRLDDPAHLPLFHTLVESRYHPQGWEKIEYAIEKGVDVNQTPKPPLRNVGTALHVVIVNESFNDAVRLIEMMGSRYDPNIRDEEEKTALIIAAKAMGTKVVEALIKQHKPELKIDAQDKDGRTALHYACAYGLSEMAEALLNAGARGDIKDNNGRTAEDSLRLTPPQVREMLKSIEISADRDVGATWNAVVTSDFIPFSDKDGKAILATKENMVVLDGEFKKAIKRRGDSAREQKDLEFLDKQKSAMTGTSIMKKVLAGRKEVLNLLERSAIRAH